MSEANFPPENLKEIYDFAVQLAKDAGRILMDGVEARCGNEATPAVNQVQVEKDSSVDIVTQTDEGTWCFHVSPFGSVVRPRSSTDTHTRNRCRGFCKGKDHGSISQPQVSFDFDRYPTWTSG